MARSVTSATITRLEDGRFRAAVDYQEEGQAQEGEVESFETFEEATSWLIEKEANPSAPATPANQTEPSPGHTGLAQSLPQHSADPNAQDSPVTQGAQDSPVDQTAAAPSNPSDIQNTNTAASDGLASSNEQAKAEQDAGTAS